MNIGLSPVPAVEKRKRFDAQNILEEKEQSVIDITLICAKFPGENTRDSVQSQNELTEHGTRVNLGDTQL